MSTDPSCIKAIPQTERYQMNKKKGCDPENVDLESRPCPSQADSPQLAAAQERISAAAARVSKLVVPYWPSLGLSAGADRRRFRIRDGDDRNWISTK